MPYAKPEAGLGRKLHGGGPFTTWVGTDKVAGSGGGVGVGAKRVITNTGAVATGAARLPKPPSAQNNPANTQIPTVTVRPSHSPMSSEVFVRERLGVGWVMVFSPARPNGLLGRRKARAPKTVQDYCMVTAIELESLTHVPPDLQVSWPW